MARQTTRVMITSWDNQMVWLPKIGTQTVLAAKAPASHQPVLRCTRRACWLGSTWYAASASDAR